MDDLLITCSNKSRIDELVNHLTKSFKRLQVNHGDVHDYLGMRITFLRESRSVKVSMAGYIQSLVTSIDEYSPYPAPSDLIKTEQECKLLPEHNQKEIHSTVAKILYVANHARPDIQFVASYLASRVNKYTHRDSKILLQLLGYLAGTLETSITLHIPDTQNISMKLYADASFGIH